MLGCLRAEDTAARLGGDEFAICIESHSHSPFDLASFAQRILDETRPPFAVAGTELTVRVSVGIATAGPRCTAAAEVLREADMALYAAKNAGKNCYQFFETGLHESAVARLEKRASLENAVEAGELRVHYQPIVRLSDTTMVGVEALVRWEHPTLGLVPPQDFVPLAEESGLVVPMGSWVLDQACKDLARWQRRLPAPNPPMRVSVNVAARQLQSAAFVDVVDEALARHGVPASSLTLEITESALVNDSDAILERLAALHERGVVLALDDFGTGYSSLSYLHRFPIDVLKIDRSFVSGVDTTTDRSMILDAIVSLARSLDLGIVAEGIEHETQAARLEQLGCDLGQGFLYSRPVPAAGIDGIIGRGSHPASLAGAATA
ncbi:MAG TPA: bifunctional diguanylate cyclase/phosphodiesterase [Acidimicrobiales bacterium]|nr:bifunctional diguanylate cyclase/phosphodiesterase [Acidimicrobiales bacterium]